MMGLEVREAHLNLLSLIARSKECLGLHLAARQVAGVLVHVAYDPARGHVWAASRLEPLAGQWQSQSPRGAADAATRKSAFGPNATCRPRAPMSASGGTADS